MTRTSGLLLLRTGLAIAAAATPALYTAKAHALAFARATQRGFILVDREGTGTAYNARVPVLTTPETLTFVTDVTRTLRASPGSPRAEYIALMQTSPESNVTAFYLGLFNDTLGIGARSPFGDREVYDLNGVLGTRFHVTGFVFLNDLRVFLRPATAQIGRTLICTQEFGHRYGTHLLIPPRPAVDLDDAGVRDAPVEDAALDAAPGDDAAPTDGAAPDVASTPDAGPVQDQPPYAMLGRDRAHWSYFLNSGGSPMEGNGWEEISPGEFRSTPPTFQFSPLDLYIMGLLPASAVPPFWLIAQPDVNAQLDLRGSVINAASPTEYTMRTVNIRGRKLTFTIDDVIRANGPRMPAYRDPDAGTTGADAGPGPDLSVLWVLLTTEDRVTDQLADDFDRAIESCTAGYDEATANRSRLVATRAVMPDASTESDAGFDDVVDARDGSADASTTAPRAGCGCSVTAAASTSLTRVLVLAGAAMMVARRSRRRRAVAPA